MPRLVVVSRYLKSGSSKKLSNYMKYIATREGAATVKENNGTAPATTKQQELISSLLKDFSECKTSFAYEKYKTSPTQKNASLLIDEIIEHNADIVANKKNYIGYLANRPGSVRFGAHGLFSQKDEPIILEQVAKEVAEHKGNVWTHVVSLRRDDAQKMGYDTLAAWRELIKRQIPNIASHSKIDLANLKWYAAFHDKVTNPHVHIVVYSTNEREGFLTEQGIEKIHSGFMNDIYADELMHLYQQQTDTRDLLKAESATIMKQLSDNITDAEPELTALVKKLYEQLNNVSGRKTYGYLPREIKRTVDELFFKLSQNDTIMIMYSRWCEMEQQKHDFYSSAKVDFPAMVDNEHFSSVKNMIIRSVSEIKLNQASVLQGYESGALLSGSPIPIEMTVSEEEVIGAEESDVPIGNTADVETIDAPFTAAAIRLLANMSHIIVDDNERHQRNPNSRPDKKLRRIIDRKKQDMGIKQDYT